MISRQVTASSCALLGDGAARVVTVRVVQPLLSRRQIEIVGDVGLELARDAGWLVDRLNSLMTCETAIPVIDAHYNDGRLSWGYTTEPHSTGLTALDLSVARSVRTWLSTRYTEQKRPTAVVVLVERQTAAVIARQRPERCHVPATDPDLCYLLPAAVRLDLADQVKLKQLGATLPGVARLECGAEGISVWLIKHEVDFASAARQAKTELALTLTLTLRGIWEPRGFVPAIQPFVYRPNAPASFEARLDKQFLRFGTAGVAALVLAMVLLMVIPGLPQPQAGAVLVLAVLLMAGAAYGLIASIRLGLRRLNGWRNHPYNRRF